MHSSGNGRKSAAGSAPAASPIRTALTIVLPGGRRQSDLSWGLGVGWLTGACTHGEADQSEQMEEPVEAGRISQHPLILLRHRARARSLAAFATFVVRLRRVCTLTDPPLNVPHEPLPASTCVLSAFHWLVWCVETLKARPASASSNSDLMCHTPRDTLRHCRGMFESNTARTRFDARSSRGGGTNCTLREDPHVPGRRVVCWTAVGVVAHAHLTRSARRTRLRPARPPPTCARHAPCRRPPSPAAPESGAWRARPPS